jgi:DNA-binding helix-hairpin-helix protein with protein kinase domain
LDDQLAFYERESERERKIEDRITNTGRLISLGVALFGALGAVVERQWQDIWAAALGVASTMLTTQTTRARHHFLVDSYSTAAVKLRFAKATWNISPKTQADADQLIAEVESILSDENAGWVQQMLLKPVVPYAAAAGTSPKP